MRSLSILLQEAPLSSSPEASLALWQEAREHWLNVDEPGDPEDSLRQLLRSLAHPTARLIRQVLQDGWLLASALLDNPALPPGEAHLFFHETAERWKTEALDRDYGMDTLAKRILLQGRSRGMLDAHSPSILTLASLLPRYPGNVEPGTHEDHASRNHLLNLTELLLDFPDLPRESLFDLAELPSVRENAAHLRRLVAHPHADLELWHRLLGRVRAQRLEMLEALAERGEARRDPQLRRAMEEHASHPPLLAALCLEAGAETREHFLHLRDRSPGHAAELLTRPEFHPAQHLAREDLLPLLSSPEAETRLAALLGASRLAAPARPPVSPLRS